MKSEVEIKLICLKHMLFCAFVINFIIFVPYGLVILFESIKIKVVTNKVVKRI
jgi:hypothetical protein